MYPNPVLPCGTGGSWWLGHVRYVLFATNRPTNRTTVNKGYGVCKSDSNIVRHRLGANMRWMDPLYGRAETVKTNANGISDGRAMIIDVSGNE